MNDPEIENSLQQFQAELMRRIENPDYSSILAEIQNDVRTSIDLNFSAGGRYGNGLFGGGGNKWLPSKRAQKQQGQTLLDTGRLVSSIQVRVNQNGNDIEIIAGSNLPYAAIHNFGGVISRSPRSSLTVQKRYTRGPNKGKFKKMSEREKSKIGKGHTFGAYQIKMPARPYLVLQDEDIKVILERIAKALLK
jgi:phage gpG-like protein